MTHSHVGYQGVPGSFSEQALRQFFAAEAPTVEFRNFEDVFEALHNGRVEYGILPIENSNTGMVFDVYDCLQQYNLHIVGETYVKVEHHLLGVPGSTLADVREVYSHPQGFSQSRRYLRRYDGTWRLIPYYNTAISAQYVAEQADPRKACIASDRCREIYGLQSLQAHIHDEARNFTRFIVIGRELSFGAEADKLSVLYSLPHTVGSLYTSLGIFADHNINLLSVQSRPIKGRPWEWYFYVDLAGNLDEDNVQSALQQLEQLSQYLQVLGCYGARPDRLPLQAAEEERV